MTQKRKESKNIPSFLAEEVLEGRNEGREKEGSGGKKEMNKKKKNGLAIYKPVNLTIFSVYCGSWNIGAE